MSINDFVTGMIVLIVVCVISFVFGMAIGTRENNAIWEQKCINLGVGQYNSQTAEFEFIEIEVREEQSNVNE